MKDRVVGFALAYEGTDAYVPFGHETGEAQLSKRLVVEKFRPILADRKISKVVHNGLYDVEISARDLGLEINNIHDTLLMSYSLDGQKYLARGHGFDALCMHHFGINTIRFQDVVISQLGMRGFQDVDLGNAAHYAAEDARETLRLYGHLKGLLKAEGLWSVYQDCDRKLVKPLAMAKLTGMRIDWEKLSRLHDLWMSEIQTRYAALRDLIGYDVNVASVPKLRELLYEKLKLPVPGGLDPDEGSTADKALEILAWRHPAVEHIRRIKALQKLVGSFCESWPEFRIGERIHPEIRITSTNTCRFSGADPNVQQIPTRTDDGAMLRECVIPLEDDHVIVSVDWSNLQLRLAAHIAGVEKWITAFHAGRDIHGETALQVFKANPKDPKSFKGFRAKSKTLNFGFLFGSTEYGISGQLRIPVDEAREMVNEYHATYPELGSWSDNEKALAHDNGYSQALLGHRIHVPSINHRDEWKQRSAERTAVCGVIQGTEGEMCRLATPVAAKCADAYGASLLAPVHDELVFSCPRECAEEFGAEIENIMEHCMDDHVEWRVPMKAEAKSGSNWREAK